MTNITHIIGIDPGANTGFAILEVKTRKLFSICTTNAPTAQSYIEGFKASAGGELLVVVEDARLRSGVPNQYAAKLAAVIKNNCKLWEQWLILKGFQFVMQAPRRGGTKLTADYFKLVTGYQGRTSEHSRDAGMIAFTFNLAIWEQKKLLKP